MRKKKNIYAYFPAKVDEPEQKYNIWKTFLHDWMNIKSELALTCKLHKYSAQLISRKA